MAHDLVAPAAAGKVVQGAKKQLARWIRSGPAGRAAPRSRSTRASAAGDDDCRVPGRKVKATRADGHDPLLCTSRLLEPDDGDHDRCYQFTHFLASLSSRDRSGCY